MMQQKPPAKQQIKLLRAAVEIELSIPYSYNSYFWRFRQRRAQAAQRQTHRRVSRFEYTNQAGARPVQCLVVPLCLVAVQSSVHAATISTFNSTPLLSVAE